MLLNKLKMSAKINQYTEIPTGFCYVPQDHYYLANLAQSGSIKYIYSDGATSCIIVIATGANAQGETIVLLGHLSKPASFEAFFDLVALHVIGKVQLFAQGANTAPSVSGEEDQRQYVQTNIDLLNNWVEAHTLPNEPWYIAKKQLWLNKGHPLEQNRDCLGINLVTMEVSNRSFELTNAQRDPLGGLQTLVSLFGADLQPPIALRLAHQPFSHAQTKQLLYLGLSYGWLDILEMEDDEILHSFSSTPHCEVAWFCDAIRHSAQYVKENLHWLLEQ